MINTRFSWIFLTIFLTLTLLALPQQAKAQSCTFSATDIALGSVDVLGTSPKDATGNISVNCASFLGLLSSITIRINLGEGNAGLSGSLRRMTSPGNTTGLRYDLYQDAAHTIMFGGTYGSHGGQQLVLSGSALLNLLTSSGAIVPIYARAPGGQSNVAPGSYSSVFNRNPTDVRVDYRTCNLLLICVDRTATFSFTVRAQVVPDCRVLASDLDFGTHGLLSQPVDASSNIRVTCTLNSSYNVGLDYGLYGSNIGNRQMRNLSGNPISYQLFRDGNRTLSWGRLVDGLASTSAGTGTMQDFTVYGRVPAQTTPAPGVYSDTVVVVVTY